MKQKKLIIEWHSLLRDLLWNSWIIILSVLLGLMGTYVVEHSIYKPEYRSSATMVVTVQLDTYSTINSLSMETQMAGIMSNVFRQDSMKQRAAAYLGMDKFQGSVSVRQMKDTNVFDLQVTASSPETAYRELNAILTVYPEICDIVFANTYIYTLREPTMPKSPSNSINTGSRNLIVLACVALSTGLILLFSLLRDTVKDEASFRDRIDASLIESVLHEKKHLSLRDRIKRKKVGLLIHNNVSTSLQFTESYYKIAAKLEYAGKQHHEKVIAITSVAENEGKSTAAANIALALAGKGHKVLLVDLDVKKPALIKLFEVTLSENESLNAYLQGSIPLEAFTPKRFKNTSLYLAFNQHALGSRLQLFENGSVARLLDCGRSSYDFVIVDTAPMSVDSAVTNIVKMVDKSYLIVRTDVVPSVAINEAILTIKNVGGAFGGCILNDVYSEFTLFGQAGFDETGYYGTRYDKYDKYEKAEQTDSRNTKYTKSSKYSRYSRYSRYNVENSLEKYGKYADYAHYQTVAPEGMDAPAELDEASDRKEGAAK